MDENQLEDQINNLTTEIEQITNDLTALHLREAVLKDRLNKRISSKLQLVDHQQVTRHQEGTTEVHIPVSAVVVPDTDTSFPTRLLHKKKKDRDGVDIDIGDEVYFLTKGQNKSNTGVVNRITSTYIHCIDFNQIKTKRTSNNLRIKEKFHEC